MTEDPRLDALRRDARRALKVWWESGLPSADDLPQFWAAPNVIAMRRALTDDEIAEVKRRFHERVTP